MKNSTILTVLAAVAFMFTSCQKEDVVAQANVPTIDVYDVTNVYLGAVEGTVQAEACEPENTIEVQVNIKSITVSSYRHITFEHINGSTNKMYFDYVDEYRVENESIDGGGYYYTKALRLYEGDTLSDDYILLLDFCEEDKMTLFFTGINQMVYTLKQ